MENHSDRMGFALIALSVVAFVLLAINGPLKSTVGGFFLMALKTGRRQPLMVYGSVRNYKSRSKEIYLEIKP